MGDSAPSRTEFSGSAPEKGDRTRGFHETERHIVHKEYFTHCLSSQKKPASRGQKIKV